VLALRDLLRDLAVRVVAGEAGTGGAVRWVHISEIVDPTPWLSGGELLLTTGLQLAEPGAQRGYVERLAGHGLAGLGFGTGFTHETVPAPMVEAADELGFPLFEVPYEVPFIAVTEKAFSHLVNEHYAVLQRALSAHERLERIVLSERGLDGVAGALASLVGGAAVVFDARGDVLALRSAGDPPSEAVAGAATPRAASWRAGRSPCPCLARRRTRPARRRAPTVPRPRRGLWRPRTTGRSPNSTA
jgi:purine catabolism regulator